MNPLVFEASFLCPFCGKHTSASPTKLQTEMLGKYDSLFRELEVEGTPHYAEGNGSRWWLGKCNACQSPVLIDRNGHRVYPRPQAAEVAREIPDPMRSDLNEALVCFSAGAYNAAVVMARRALQCAAVEQGATKGDALWKQIKWLDDNRKITAQQRDWADAARWVGNHGAHDTEPKVSQGNPVITNVDRDDAQDTLELVHGLFEALYVATARAKAQLGKRGQIPKT